MLKVKALLFDVFGTVVDWRSGIINATEIIAKKIRLILIQLSLQIHGEQNISQLWKKLEKVDENLLYWTSFIWKI